MDGGCQGILPIQLVNANAGAGNTGSSPLNIPHVLQTTGERRVVVVMVASDGNNQTGARISGVSYMNGATALPLTLAHELWSGNRVWSGIYWIRDAQLPAPGNYSVRVTGSGAEFAKIASVYELKGVDQTNPVDNVGRAVAGGATGNCGTSDPNHSVTTVTNNTWVLSTVSTFGTDAGSVQTGQTQTHSSVSGGMGFKASYKPNLPIGSNNIRWNMTNCNAAAHALVALKPATAP